MENAERLEKIKQLIKDEYGDKMPEEYVKGLAEDLNLSVFKCKFGIDDIFCTVFQYEEELNIEDTRSYYIFCGVVDMLDNCEETAEMLYETFMHHWEILEIFLKLYFENEEYISKDKFQAAKEKAFEIFDKEILRLCGVTD